MTDSSSLKGQKYVRDRSSINGREGLQNGRGGRQGLPQQHGMGVREKFKPC